MRLLFGEDVLVAHWVAMHIPHMLPMIPYFEMGQVFGPSRSIGVVDEAGNIVGGVVYHNHNPFYRSIELSCASEGGKWLTGDILRALLRYSFSQIHCVRCTSVTPRRATSTRRFLEKLGFKREGLIRRGFGDDHAVVYGLLAEEWEAGRFSGHAPSVSGALSTIRSQRTPESADQSRGSTVR